MATTFELHIWAEGYATDADGNPLDAQGNPINPERVLTPNQTETFERLVRATDQEEPK